MNELELRQAVVKASCDRGSRADRTTDVAAAIRTFGGYCWVGIYDVGLEQIAIVGWDGPAPPAHPRFPRTDGLCGVAVATQRTVLVGDVADDARYLTTHATTGARGCTTQSRGVRDQYQRLRELGAQTAGLSAEEVAEQRKFAARVGLPYRLISDATFKLAAARELPTFTASGRTFYRRLAVVVERGVIVNAFDPIDAPAENAAEVIRWLESPAAQEAGTS